MKLSLRTATLIVLLATVLMACGAPAQTPSNNASTAAPAAAAPAATNAAPVANAAAMGQPVTLTLWTVQFNDEALSAVNGIIADYEAANPTIKVKLETRGVDPHKEALRVSLNTPAAPDMFIIWGGIGLGGFYVQSGNIEPLESYYQQYNWGERFLPSALDAMKFDGKYYGVPYTVHGMGLYYRKDLFQKAGITGTPTTYAELLAANNKLKAAGLTPLSIGGKFGWNTMRLLDSLLETKCGKQTFDELRTLTASWADQACVTASFQELRTWSDQGFLPKNFLGLDPAEAKNPVYQGTAAMLYEGDWNVGTLKSDEQDLANYDFFPFPTGTDRLSFFVEMFFMTKSSQHKSEAAQFINYFTSPEVQTKYLGKASSISPTKGTQTAAKQLPLDVAWGKTMASYAATYPPSDQALPNELTAAYFKVQDDTLAGTITPDQVGKIFQAEIDKFKAAAK